MGENSLFSFIALEDYTEEKGLEEPVFYRDDMDLYLMTYFRDAWYKFLSAYDTGEQFENEITFVLVDHGTLRQ